MNYTTNTPTVGRWAILCFVVAHTIATGAKELSMQAFTLWMTTRVFPLNTVGVLVGFYRSIKTRQIMAKRLSQQGFINKAKCVHGDKYDYSETVYINNHTKVKIICRTHGVFYQYPQAHVDRRHGCPLCAKENRKIRSKQASETRKTSRDDFIVRARKVHGSKFDYSLLPNKFHMRDKIKIICPRHGVFEQNAGNHLTGRGCNKCKYNTLTPQEFVDRAKEIHGDTYDYSRVDYRNATTKVAITCKIHGVFLQTPILHLRGCGCPKCKPSLIASKHVKENGTLYLKDKTKWFIQEARKVHGNNYIYDKVQYTKSCENVTITCRKHGDFQQTPNSHLCGSGCEKCGKDKISIDFRISLEDFIETSNKIHFNKYEYSLVKLPERTTDKVEIICPIHGVFKQTMYAHVHGNGCPCCRRFSKGEAAIDNYLSKKGFKYKRQFFFRNENLFCKNKRCFVDFCVFKGNKKIFIEYNGNQHYEPVEHWGGEEKYNEQKERDLAVEVYCSEHHIKLIVIPYTEFDNIETILTKEL